MLIDGPHGLPAVIDERSRVLIAGGSGITPSMSVLRTAADRGDLAPTCSSTSTATRRDFSFADELDELGRRLNLEVVLVPSRPAETWTGASGRLSADLLDRLLPADRREWTLLRLRPARHDRYRGRRAPPPRHSQGSRARRALPARLGDGDGRSFAGIGEHRVDSPTAVERVVAAHPVPRPQGVGAPAAEQLVGARPAVEKVVIGLAEHPIVTLTGPDDVVTGAERI